MRSSDQYVFGFVCLEMTPAMDCLFLKLTVPSHWLFMSNQQSETLKIFNFHFQAPNKKKTIHAATIWERSSCLRGLWVIMTHKVRGHTCKVIMILHVRCLLLCTDVHRKVASTSTIIKSMYSHFLSTVAPPDLLQRGSHAFHYTDLLALGSVLPYFTRTYKMPTFT